MHNLVHDGDAPRNTIERRRAQRGRLERLRNAMVVPDKAWEAADFNDVDAIPMNPMYLDQLEIDEQAGVYIEDFLELVTTWLHPLRGTMNILATMQDPAMCNYLRYPFAAACSLSWRLWARPDL